ncbi:MAG: carboxylate--amine ligase [Candidatus Hodarchaeales archaeon]
MNYYKIPVIILGGDAVNVLAMSRNLGVNNINVIYLSKNRNEVPYSKYCHKYFIIPDIEIKKELLRDFLLKTKKIIKNQAVVFSCSDLLSISLSQLENNLSEKYIFFTDGHVIPILVNKRNFYLSLRKYGVPHPNTYYPVYYEDIKEIGKSVKYPVLIKPAIGQLFSRFGRKSFIARSKTELEKYCKIVLKYNIEYVIQEIIPGPPQNMYGLAGYFDKNHEPKGLFAYRRIREWPPGLGNGSIIESIPVHDIYPIKNIIIDYLKKIKYNGLFDAEIKKDSHDGNFKLIEINARSWWQNHFPTVCGLNLVMMAYCDAIGEKIEYCETYETGVRWVYLMNDLLSSLKMLKKGDITLGEWSRSYKTVKDYAFYNSDDIVPWFIHLLMVVFVSLRSLKRKLF